VNLQNETSFSSFTTVLFSQRRKMLRRTLASILHSESKLKLLFEKLAVFNILPELRVETLSPAQIFQMFETVENLK
jgi:16S rRNA A1518/A1519 N6-dimethyltransferase RsmA/KsgA/DIM1 with predicted DNA glycosylase/AP lyase activity